MTIHWIVLITSSAGVYAAYQLLVKTFSSQLSYSVGVLFLGLGAFFSSIVIYVSSGGPQEAYKYAPYLSLPAKPETLGAACLAFLAGATTLFGGFLLVKSYALLDMPASVVTPLLVTVTTVFVFLGSFIFFHEPVNYSRLLGAMVSLFGVWLLLR